jgi:hypothetical protein
MSMMTRQTPANSKTHEDKEHIPVAPLCHVLGCRVCGTVERLIEPITLD